MNMATKEFQEVPGKENHAKSFDDVEQMQQIPTFTPEGDEETHVLIELIRKIPYFEDFLKDSDESGEFISALLETKSGDTPSPSLTEATTGFHYAHMVLAIINFIRIPLMYAAAWITGTQLPFKLSVMGKMTYSAALLALAITTIILPALATVMGIAATSLGLGLSIYTLGNYFYQRVQLKNQIKDYEQAIAAENGQFEAIKEQSAQDLLDLKVAIKNGDKESVKRLTSSIEKLKGVFDHSVKRQQIFHNERYRLQKKLEKYSSTALTDRGVAFALTSGLLTGLTVGLFFPPVGFGIAAASTILSLAYITKRFIIPFVSNKFHQWQKKREAKSSASSDEGSEPENVLNAAPEAQTEATNTMHIHESTTDTMLGLGTNQAVMQRSSSLISDDGFDEDLDKTRVTPQPTPHDELEEGEGEREREGEKSDDEEVVKPKKIVLNQ